MVGNLFKIKSLKRELENKNFSYISCLKLIDDILKDETSVFYPRCFVNKSQEFPQLDYYYVGNLFLEIEGLMDNEFIEYIYIYYE